jgi:lipoprotein-releasing system permease protein
LYYLPLRFTLFGINSGGMLTGSAAGQHQKFWYIDKYGTGLFDVDVAMLVDFDQLQELCWMRGQDGEAARTNEIRIKLKDGVDANGGLLAIRQMWQEFVAQQDKDGHGQLLRDVVVQDWQEYRRAFIAPVEKEKTLMIIVFGMVGIVAIFIIFAIFYMIVTEKIKDLGIVKSVGGSSGTLGEIFLGFGMLVGVIGAGIGTALGCAIVLNSNEIENVLYRLFGFRLWPPEVYAISRIPDAVDFSEAALIVVIAVLASVAGAAIPAWRAARLTVVDALRVE